MNFPPALAEALVLPAVLPVAFDVDSATFFAGTLSGFLDRPVVDMTGLTGGFKINLEWAPDEMQSNPNAIEGRTGDGVPGPTIYTALHEVGLKLESRKAPVEILVVDHAQKVPVEN